MKSPKLITLNWMFNWINCNNNQFDFILTENTINQCHCSDQHKYSKLNTWSVRNTNLLLLF